MASPVSYESLARELSVSSHTVKKWISILERFYIIFKVHPYSKNIARSMIKQPKIYFYDTAYVKAGEGARFENAIALSLLKYNFYMEDTMGDSRVLHYVRDKDKREVDFLTVADNVPEYLIEVKINDIELKNIKYFQKIIPKAKAIYMIQNLRKELNYDGIHVVDAAKWLSELPS